MSDNQDNIGILDPEGINNNPLTNNPYSDEYRKLGKIWSKFPAYKRAHEIINAIKDNQIIVLTSSTGSGKTVLLPKFTIHALGYTGKIAVTLPKQITAKSAAEFAAKTLDVVLGKEIGYQYKGSKMKSNSTKILYATDGTIVQQIMNDPYLKEYDAVIIDEAHERKVQIDFLLYLLRKTAELRPEFKLIVMSATINTDIFEQYFEKFKHKVLDIEGETNYPIESIFLKQPVGIKDYIEKGYEILKQIINSDKDSKGNKDIIFFVTSINETIDICTRINTDKIDGYCIEVYSGITPEKELIATNKDLYKTLTDTKDRKIIIATSVAESSLTFDGIKYVIDSGYELFGYYDPDKDANVLEKKLITHAQAKQRMGRSGRTEAGICYHLYTQDDFENKMERYPEPSIRVSDIYGECLKLLTTVETVEKLLEILSSFIEPPREKYIHKALRQLRQLELINDNRITDFGKTISELQMDPMSAIATYISKKLRCTREVLQVICLIDATRANMSQLFQIPSEDIKDTDRAKQMLKKYESARNTFKNKYGDHIAMYEIISKYLSYKEKNDQNKLSEFTYKYFLKSNVLNKATQYYNKFKYIIPQKLLNVKYIENIDSYTMNEKIMACFAYGYRLHTGYLHGNNYNTSSAKNININKESFINLRSTLPNQVIYHELFKFNDKMELNIVSSINSNVEELLKKI
jgi:HrpA-like RNA helicase